MSAPYRVRLRTVAARQLWDGRKARGGRGFIPGIRHFQAGVRSPYSARGASDIVAAERLAEVDAALGTVARSLARWRNGLEGFVAESLGSVCVGADRGPWLRASRSIRNRARERRRLALLIAAYDAACAATVGVTATARKLRVYNAYHECIAERARLIRAVASLGHSGVGLQMGGSAANAGAADVPQHSAVRRNATASRRDKG